MVRGYNQQNDETGGDLDTRLFNSGNTESEDDGGSGERVGALRSAKRDTKEQEPNFLEEEPTNLRQAVIQAKRQKKTEAAKSAAGKVVQKASQIRKGTSALLRASWTNLITSWGLTTFWINTHVFLNRVLGDKIFCKLGEEWVDQAGISGSAKEALSKKVGSSVGLVEKMGLGCLNLGCLTIIFAVLMVIALLLNIDDYFFEILKDLSGFTWDYVKNLLIN